MEPQHNYSPNPGTGQTVYGRKSSKKGCFIIGLIFVLLVGIGGAYLIYYIYGKVDSKIDEFSDKFKKDRFIGNRNEDSRFAGAFMDAVLVPSGDGSKLFILTDGSKTYIETKKSPGRYSTGRACIDCKTIAYVYDPASDNIIKSTEYKFPDVITASDIAINNGRVYQFTRSYHETEAGVNIYDANTGALLSRTEDFISAHPELSSGISELNYRNKQRYAEFNTKDGKTRIIYSVEHDKIFASEKELTAMLESSVSGEGYIFAMANLNSDARRQLYKVTAPKSFILSRSSTLMDYAGKPGMLKMYNASSEEVSDKSYIEGIIYFQDEDYVFIVSQDQAGKQANRMLTCVDIKTGKEKWTVKQEELFDFMKIDEVQNSSQSLSSTKDKISVSRLGKTVILKFKGDGVMGFDTETGKKLWSIQTAPVGLGF